MTALVADTPKKSDPDYVVLQQVRVAIKGKSQGHKRELVAIVKGLRDRRTLAAVKQLIAR